MDSYRTILNTDAWRAYRGLNAVRDHRVVNHSTKGKYRFVTKEGIHTNNAEPCHSSVKRGIRKQGRLSMHPHKADEIVALHTLFFKNANWQERFRALLLALKSVKDEVEREEVERDQDNDNEETEDDSE